MIYTKPFIGILLLICLVSMTFAQAPSPAEVINNSANLIPTPTENISNSSSTTIASKTSTTITSTPTSLSSSSIVITTTPIINSISSTTSNVNAIPTVQTTGWDSSGNSDSEKPQSWLRQNNRFVFVIVLGLLFLAVLIWYIVRSIKGMRKRLEQENQAQLYMMQQATSPQQAQQQQNAAAAASRNDRVIPELTQTPPPAYKIEEHPQQNNGHPRY
ncbi:unnamed protein product [Mucor hiemalis]